MNLLHCFFIILLLNKNSLLVQGDEKTIFRMSDKVIQCSSNLSRIIHEFCANVHKIVKRHTSVIIGKLIPESLDSHMKSEREKRWRRVRRQVATECCEQPCTVSNILLYCPYGADVLTSNPGIFD